MEGQSDTLLSLFSHMCSLGWVTSSRASQRGAQAARVPYFAFGLCSTCCEWYPYILPSSVDAAWTRHMLHRLAFLRITRPIAFSPAMSQTLCSIALRVLDHCSHRRLNSSGAFVGILRSERTRWSRLFRCFATVVVVA